MDSGSDGQLSNLEHGNFCAKSERECDSLGHVVYLPFRRRPTTANYKCDGRFLQDRIAHYGPNTIPWLAGDSNSNSFTYGYAYADSNANCHAYTYTYANRDTNAKPDTDSDAYAERDYADGLRAQGARQAHGRYHMVAGNLGQYRHLPRWSSDRDGAERRFLHRFDRCPWGQRAVHVQGMRSGHFELLESSHGA